MTFTIMERNETCAERAITKILELDPELECHQVVAQTLHPSSPPPVFLQGDRCHKRPKPTVGQSVAGPTNMLQATARLYRAVFISGPGCPHWVNAKKLAHEDCYVTHFRFRQRISGAFYDVTRNQTLFDEKVRYEKFASSGECKHLATPFIPKLVKFESGSCLEVYKRAKCQGDKITIDAAKIVKANGADRNGFTIDTQTLPTIVSYRSCYDHIQVN